MHKGRIGAAARPRARFQLAWRGPLTDLCHNISLANEGVDSQMPIGQQMRVVPAKCHKQSLHIAKYNAIWFAELVA
jgi:hypothetical protein